MTQVGNGKEFSTRQPNKNTQREILKYEYKYSNNTFTHMQIQKCRNTNTQMPDTAQVGNGKEFPTGQPNICYGPL